MLTTTEIRDMQAELDANFEMLATLDRGNSFDEICYQELIRRNLEIRDELEASNDAAEADKETW